MTGLSTKILNMRRGPFKGGALAFFSLAIGYRNEDGEFQPVFVVRDCSLRERKDDGEHFISWPAKKRMRDGEAVLENGKPIYDEQFGMFREKTGEGVWRVPKAAYPVLDAVIEQAVKANKAEADEGKGRGGERGDGEIDSEERGTPLKKAAKKVAPEDEGEDEKPRSKKRPAPPADDDDDSLPFS